jgi:5-methyltetrahydrofolate--homocysteine methyltransferase
LATFLYSSPNTGFFLQHKEGIKMGRNDDALKQALVSLDMNQVQSLVDEKIGSGQPAGDIINILTQGLDEIGDLFSKDELYIPELVRSGQIFEAVMKKLEPYMSDKETDQRRKGRVVIGTVKGDLHDLGKNLVVNMIRTSGFEVIDIGKDVATEKFIEVVLDTKPDVIGLSALLTTTMAMQAEVIEALEKENLRNDLKVIVGGAPVSEEWAEEIGADAYGSDAVDAVRIVKDLTRRGGTAK